MHTALLLLIVPTNHGNKSITYKFKLLCLFKKKKLFSPEASIRKRHKSKRHATDLGLVFLKYDATSETNFNNDLIDPFMSCYLSNMILYSLMSLKMTKKSYFNFIDCL